MRKSKYVKHKCQKKREKFNFVITKNAKKCKVLITFIELIEIFFKLFYSGWRKVGITFLESNSFDNIYHDA